MFNEQIYRIKAKLTQAKETDTQFKTFGSGSHKYHLNPPATNEEVLVMEEKYSVQLPECYRTFVTEIGNGGISYLNSAAGPYYGIYPMGTHITDLMFNATHVYLENSCLLYPDMPDEVWETMIKPLTGDDDISNDDYDKELSKVFGGIVPIGSQGCTYLHALVLNGEHKGRVVNVDQDLQKPHFSPEKNFLDWYEKWLDEIISGALTTDQAGWYGF